MARPALNEAIELFSDRRWRLNNLYHIEDKHGDVVKFELNATQNRLLEDLHDLNIILKARQMGFSTFILILALDCCVFNSHFDAGLIADTLDNAKGLLARVKFAYERMPKDIRDVVSITTDNAQQIEFSNSSSIEVGVSLRSSTKNFLHISEYGKICAKQPDKAREIKSGALNTLAKGQLGFIESTAEGRSGDFYDKVRQAEQIRDIGRDPHSMEWKFHFFPWWADASYSSADPVHLSREIKDYFASLESEHGITLTDGQKAWYALKAQEQGDDMWKEYPSTPDEAFKAARDGAYFAKEIRSLRQLRRVGSWPIDPALPVNTFWDWGLNDATSIWLHQQVAGRNRFVGFYENSGEGPAHYADWLDKWRAMRSARFGIHYAPHDFDTRRPGSHGEIITLKGIFQGLGYEMQIVERSADKGASIQNARGKLPGCEFDDTECADGLLHLESYSRDWDDKYGVWKSQPRHDEHSHPADAFMTFADGYEAPSKTVIPQRSMGWVL